MAITAHFEEQGKLSGRDARRTLRLDTTGALATGSAAAVTIHNISATGLLLESAAALVEGEEVAVDLPLAGLCPARVVWRSDGYFGCRFHSPISQAALAAVELRSAAVPAERTQAVPDSAFGLRLQRLRAERGLTQAQIAGALGVSKPTVWAWEHGKARPVESRMAPLAELLGVTRGDLVQGALAPNHGNLIDQAREQIAAAYGVHPGSVKIRIDL